MTYNFVQSKKVLAKKQRKKERFAGKFMAKRKEMGKILLKWKKIRYFMSHII
jgi:hypothetical protein